MTARSLYAELGIELPEWSTREAPVRCFAQPDAHRRGDRSPSCSVNLASGAWNCHGCGAHGGAYDAALATGHSPRSAMQLLIAHGLAEPRASARELAPVNANHPRRHIAQTSPSTLAADTPLAATEDNVQLWVQMLDINSRLIGQLTRKRGWGWRAIQALQLGFDRERITIPIRDRHDTLRGVLRYDPFGRRHPKMLAVPGTRLGLIPHPAREASDRVILVEGPPDMIAARSRGLAAIAIPGTRAWQPAWAQLLTGRYVTIVMDCDPAGRRAAREIAESLQIAGVSVEVVDLWPDRADGYDLTDRILEHRRAHHQASSAQTTASLLRPVPTVNAKRKPAPARSTQEVTR